MWVRFRTEGNPASRVARRWRERVAQYEAEALATEQSDVDPELRAWREYVSGLGPTDADREGPASMPPSLERP